MSLGSPLPRPPEQLEPLRIALKNVFGIPTEDTARAGNTIIIGLGDLGVNDKDDFLLLKIEDIQSLSEGDISTVEMRRLERLWYWGRENPDAGTHWNILNKRDLDRYEVVVPKPVTMDTSVIEVSERRSEADYYKSKI